jgi:molybdopterin/thiamine biosynthesis adenylyltransferase
MRLKASIPSYKQIEVELNPSKTVRELRNAICAKLEIEPELTKLLLRNEALPERVKLSKLKGIEEPVIVDYFWARHLVLWGAEAQRRIRKASVLLAGAGAIGNEVAKNLAMLGVGKLFIIDRDRVELSNVSRMIFFQPSDLGKNKAEVLARNIQRKYPFVETLAFRGDLERLPLKFYLDSDVLVSGLDNAVSRIYLAQICRKYSIPMVDGGITGLSARVHSYIPPNDACPICIFPPNQYSQIVGLRNPCDAPIEQETVPSLATSISLVSSIMSQETIKVILGLKEYLDNAKWPEKSGQPLRSVLFVDLKNNRYTTLELKRGEKCFVCGKEGTAKDPALRKDLPLLHIRHSTQKLEDQIRKTMKVAEKIPLRVFTETSSGERKLGKPSVERERIREGDYLRILAESENGESRESILRLS